MMSKFDYLRKYPKAKRKKTYWEEFDKFSASLKKLFDIKGSAERIASEEKVWEIKMTKEDYCFYDNQC